MDSWYVRVRGRVLGPFPFGKLQEMRDRGQLQSFYEVSTDQATWKAAGSVPELFPAMGITRRPTEAAPPQAPMSAAPRPMAAPPKKRGSMSLFLVLGGAAALVALMAIVAVVVLVFVLNRDSGHTTDKAGIITFTPKTDQTEQYDTIKSSVGLVVCALDVYFLDGKHEEILVSTGTCFAVNSEGYLLTNHHVVFTMLRLAEPKAIDGLLVRLKAKKITPTIWVLFSKTDKYLTDVRFTSRNYDLAVLKIDRPAHKFFAMSAKKRDEIVPGLPVQAYGFPGIQRTIHQEISAKPTEDTLGTWDQVFSEKSYSPNREDGTVTSETYEYVDDNPQMTLLRKPIVIQHRADIYAGNSGGPLLLADGTVLGINTYRVVVSDKSKGPQDWDAKRVNLSITLPQIRDEIDRNVPGVVWR
jgi:S1-C subfamily serine protease